MVSTEATVSLRTAAEGLALLVVFALPATTLLDYNIWSLVPKYHFTRCHPLSLDLGWADSSGLLVAIVVVLFCLFLEFRKRKLDGLVSRALAVSASAGAALDVEEAWQAGALRAAVRLLHASTDHYEHLLSLHTELDDRDAAPGPPPAPAPPAPAPPGPPAVNSDMFN